MADASQVLTANRLRDGAVVYWRARDWVEAVGDAEVFSRKADADEAVKAAQPAVAARLVVNPYLFTVHEYDGQHRPVEEREIIRAAGPTVRRDLGKQARHVPL